MWQYFFFLIHRRILHPFWGPIIRLGVVVWTNFYQHSIIWIFKQAWIYEHCLKQLYCKQLLGFFWVFLVVFLVLGNRRFVRTSTPFSVLLNLPLLNRGISFENTCNSGPFTHTLICARFTLNWLSGSRKIRKVSFG